MPKFSKSGFFLIAISLFPHPADALVKFDFEQRYFVEFGVEIKDHSIIRVDSVYHLFYLRGNPAVNVGHAWSLDLIHWNLAPPVLSLQAGAWDGRAMWAPQVIRYPGGGYFMYYTGVNWYWAQQSGIAFSNNLFDWVKYPTPVYHPDPAWAEWNETKWSHGRDPFVFSADGKYYMLLTAKTNTNKGAIASAVSTDLFTWQENGPLYVHTNWHVLESIQCIRHNNKWHLFFTEEVINGTSHVASDSLFSGWDLSIRGIIDLGHAPEVHQFDPGKYVFSRHGVHSYGAQGGFQYVIRLDSLRWAGDTPYVYRTWPLERDWTIVWGSAFLYQPTFLNNPGARGVPVNVNYEGMCWIGTYERYQGPLAYGSPGSYQGDGATGVIRSKAFPVTGNSMSLLVGGGNYPDACYVALVDAVTHEIIYKETGKNTDTMDRRYWDLVPHRGRVVYIEISDQSAEAFGHISCDDIRESLDMLYPIPDEEFKDRLVRPRRTDNAGAKLPVALFQNHPNPFNPVTTITYYLPEEGHVLLQVFDVGGRIVRELVNRRESEGTRRVNWNGTSDGDEFLPTGVYFYRLTVDGGVVATKKMVLIK